jgi:methionine-rich copper-binding protein CopC
MAGSLLTFASIASAHTDLANSAPGNGAVMNDAPEEMELHFTEAVRLLKFSITGADGAQVETTFKPAADAVDHFAIPLPSLAEDSYTVHWSAMGGDDHLVEKTFTFTIDADAQETEGAAAPAASSHAH